MKPSVWGVAATVIALAVVLAAITLSRGARKKPNQTNAGFTMGNHRFGSPDVAAPLDRLTQKPGGPLAGAVPPDYLVGKVRAPDKEGPASLLWNGEFCGHGEPTYGVFDLEVHGNDLFEFRMTGYDQNHYPVTPPYIEARVAGKEGAEWFPIYDTRKHPAATWMWTDTLKAQKGITDQQKAYDLLDDPEVLDSLTVPNLGDVYRHPGYNGTAFRISLGFEYPADCTSPNDTTWFALSIESPDGKVREIVFSDETG